MARRLHLGIGTLKIKTVWELRRSERQGDVPVWSIGNTYFCWHRKSRLGDNPSSSQNKTPPCERKPTTAD